MTTRKTVERILDDMAANTPDDLDRERDAPTLDEITAAVQAGHEEIEVPSYPLIYGALAQIIGDLPAIGKGQRNEAQQFNFRGIDDILEHLKPLLARYGVVYVPRVLERISEVRTTRSGTALYVIHLHVQFTFYAVDGSLVIASAWGEGSDSGDKATPKAHTGAQKSALTAALSIATREQRDDDPDRHSPEESNPYVAPPEGWASIEEHDEWRHGVRERAKALSLDAQGEFAGWWRTQVRERGWTWPLTGEQADEYGERLAQIEAAVAAAGAPFEPEPVEDVPSTLDLEPVEEASE